ncbi:hypothetical protein N7468_002894 [Penicillium chermesinum]|uniref:Tse2 ADP-ribosyltransferase toxin domain-containing protein n=1 Tax=Penicillium chermesinum TaxID=63820 RepID=A0A9W9P618_9EURO|nr:uncharacterized protein N7468_002894 [Penicillium chermesinum]KAJ5238275.1 hypothetical protein N7468_002894 [Penicillium chermesinum]KAJ6163936.1 hypothetical protein N7470_002608 [Penicillium chermesinum]
MFHGFLCRAHVSACGRFRTPNRRAFSYVSTHRTFPASLYRFQIHRDSQLFDRATGQDDWEYEDGVEVSADGLVHPNITTDCTRDPNQSSFFTYSAHPVSNGALLMPNTHFMQEITRRSFDHYLDNLESDQTSAEPHYLCIPKGTSIPDSLTLFRERTSRFSLQPAHPMSLDSLNKTLTRFYLDAGLVFKPDDWLGRNPYHEASFDDKEEWMSK